MLNGYKSNEEGEHKKRQAEGMRKELSKKPKAIL
jgi:hypothetical protein